MGQRLADSIAIHLQPAMMLVAQGVIDNIAHRSSDRAERFGQQGGTPA